MVMTNTHPFRSNQSMESTAKTISQIKRENLANKPVSYKFIETMFRSGNNFKYDLNGQQGNYKLKLSSFEVSTQEISKELAEHKNELQSLKVQSDNMKRAFNQDYAEVRRDITEEIDDFESKLKMEFNKQKTKTLEQQRDIGSLSNDLLSTKNLFVELKHRLAALKLRIEGEID